MGKHKCEESDDGSSSNIRTFLRIRPSKRPSGYIKVDEYDTTRLGFHVPVETKDGEYVNNTRTSHHFKFDGVLGEKATQEDVFAKIGKGAVSNVLNGYNSTVFAYGQTGSGKTFTVTGGAERYVDRGIIPRALSLIFAEFKERSDQQFTCHISYLEIYNEQGFDLLDPSHDSKKLEDLPKVSLMEDEDGNIHLRNLSVYLAANEEEALNYLFLGDTNRAISETAMNKASSRSHCIFTISVEGRKHGSEKVMRSKLHLVDLAGSERVHKTQTGGQTLVEAKHINVSLFFLEMVIVALRERGTRGRQHIPYRNSMMTSVLRDSLGGNCKTVMIATVNAETAQTEESISTCRFAQRVSMIKNDARINEDLDPGVLIRKLRSDCATLSDELAFLKGETGEGEELSSEEAEDLKNRCRTFVEDPAPTAQLSIGAYTLTKLKRCFSVFKAMVLDGGLATSTGEAGPPHGRTSKDAGGHAGTEARVGECVSGELGGQLLTLRDALRQRDNEIAILVNMLKQGKCHACTTRPPSATAGRPAPNRQHDPSGTSNAVHASESGARQTTNGVAASGIIAPKGTVGGRDLEESRASINVSGVAYPSDAGVSGDPQRAFEYFRERHSAKDALEENKKLLAEKYARAKAMGERVNQARSTIQYLKNTIEQVRRERALDGLMEEGRTNSQRDVERDEEDEEETKCKAAIEVEKKVYKGSFQELRELKCEIEHIQRLLEKSRSKMQAEFQAWYEPLAYEGVATVGTTHPRAGLAAPMPDQSEHPLAMHRSPSNGSVSSFDNRHASPTTTTKASSMTTSMTTATTTTRERRNEKSDPVGFEGAVAGGDGKVNTPMRRPRPPMDAWGTPPSASVNHRRGSSSSSAATGNISSECVDNGSTGASYGGAEGGGGLLPPLTGNKEADDDIAAFYRAKEELERRRIAAGRNRAGR